jgi:hypothetical protein
MKTLLTMVLSCAVFVGWGQTDPTQWTWTAKKIDDKTYELHMSVKVSSPWHIYSQQTPEGGPLPTKIFFTRNPLVELRGPVKEEGKLKEKFEEVFDLQVKYYDGQVDFVQLIKLNKKVKTSVSGSVEYMVCNDTQCLPPVTIPFTIALK